MPRPGPWALPGRLLLWLVAGQLLMLFGGTAAQVCPEEFLMDCELCVENWTMVMDFQEVAYSWGHFMNKCGARITEHIVYDLSAGGNLQKYQSRRFSLDHVDDIEFLNITSPDAMVREYAFDVIRGTTDANGNKFNSSAVIQWTFAIHDGVPTNRVRFSLSYNVVGLLKNLQDSAENFWEWYPFSGNFVSKTTFVKNVTAIVNMPFTPPSLADRSQGAFNITTNYKTEKIFRDTDFTVVYNVPCYSAEFDGIVKLFMSLPRQGRQCNEMPGWLYIVIIVMVLVVTLLLCSFLAFLFFEKPYQCIMAEDEPNRIKFLDEEDQIDEEEYQKRSKLVQLQLAKNDQLAGENSVLKR